MPSSDPFTRRCPYYAITNERRARMRRRPREIRSMAFKRCPGSAATQSAAIDFAAQQSASASADKRPDRAFAAAVQFTPNQRANGSADDRSEEHTSELQSLMRISYAVFCLKKKKHN